MKKDEHIEKVEPPIGLAGGVCAISLVASLFGIRYLSHLFDAQGWMTWFFAVSIPASLTFIVLYRSSWHRELPKTTRVLSMILSALIICAVVLLVAVLVVICAAVFFGNGMISS